jgi:hypothetical protein
LSNTDLEAFDTTVSHDVLRPKRQRSENDTDVTTAENSVVNTLIQENIRLQQEKTIRLQELVDKNLSCLAKTAHVSMVESRNAVLEHAIVKKDLIILTETKARITAEAERDLIILAEPERATELSQLTERVVVAESQVTELTERAVVAESRVAELTDALGQEHIGLRQELFNQTVRADATESHIAVLEHAIIERDLIILAETERAAELTSLLTEVVEMFGQIPPQHAEAEVERNRTMAETLARTEAERDIAIAELQTWHKSLVLKQISGNLYLIVKHPQCHITVPTSYAGSQFLTLHISRYGEFTATFIGNAKDMDRYEYINLEQKVVGFMLPLDVSSCHIASNSSLDDSRSVASEQLQLQIGLIFEEISETFHVEDLQTPVDWTQLRDN